MDRLKGAIIGCGFFGGIQLEAWRRMPEIELVAACDPDRERARKAAPKVYADAAELFAREKLDFVDIATRPEHHLPLVKLAMAARVPAICQKPIAPTWAACVEMARASESANVRLMIHENWRWQPWYRAAQAIIARGDIGAPIGYTFRTRRRDGVGPEPYALQPYFRAMPRLLIYETIVHHIDTARFLFGEIEAVYAQARRLNPVIAAEDQAVLTVTHRDGLIGLIDGHRYLDPEPDGPSLGDAVFEGDRARLRLAGSGDLYIGEERVWTNDVRDGYRGDSVRRTQQHFIECLRAGAAFESGARVYLRTVAAVEAAYRSIAERRQVTLAEIDAA